MMSASDCAPSITTLLFDRNVFALVTSGGILLNSINVNVPTPHHTPS